jgi:hypothetical protein
MAELVEGARLESEYMGLTCVEGSNPSLSATKKPSIINAFGVFQSIDFLFFRGYENLTNGG